MVKVCFKNVGQNGVTKEMISKTNLLMATSLIIREEISRMMGGRSFEVLTIGDKEYGIYYCGVIAGSFTLQIL